LTSLAVSRGDHRVAHREVIGSLVEVVHRVTTGSHYLDHQDIRLLHRPPWAVHEVPLHVRPTLLEVPPLALVEGAQLEFPLALLSSAQLGLRGAAVVLLLDRPVVLGAELFPQPLRSPFLLLSEDRHADGRDYDHRNDDHNN